MEKTFGVIGGDSRQRSLAELLLRDGRKVLTWGVEESERIKNTGLEKALSAQVVILPLPVLAAGGVFNAPFARREVRIPELLDSFEPGQILCGGQIPDSVHQAAGRRGLVLQDYFTREELTVCNAAVTAEGALQVAMERLPVTLWGCRVLVLGFGRIGKLLAHRLQSMGARVTVAARKCSDLSWIEAYGYDAVSMEKMPERLEEFRLLFNTAPSLLLDGEKLQWLRKDCLCIDLASAPGGIDFDAAQQLGLQAVWARSLPGKAAPETAGCIIRDTIYRILEERGEYL